MDVGSTFTAAAVERDGTVAAARLGALAHVVPTVVLHGDAGRLVVGEDAARRAPLVPARVAREFTRTVGDAAPVRLGGLQLGAHELVAEVVGWVVARVTELEGEQPGAVVLAVPAIWGDRRRGLVEEAVVARLGHGIETVAEPVAAVRHHAALHELHTDDAIAVYDLGGGTFDASVVRRTDGGFAVVGVPLGDERLGGVDLDRRLVDLVARRVGPSWEGLDPFDPVGTRAVAQVRLETAEVRERLSTTTEAVVPVLLPGEPARDVRVTRAEFEELVHSLLLRSVEVLGRAIAGADLTGDQLSAVLLVGGAARIPLIAQLVAQHVGATVVLDPDPKLAVCLGAVATDGGRITAPPPGADATVRFALPPMDDTSVLAPDAVVDEQPDPVEPPVVGAIGGVDDATGPGATDVDEVDTTTVATPAPAPPPPAPPVDPNACTDCGEVNAPGTSYCRRCGAPIGGGPVSFAPVPEEQDDDLDEGRRGPRGGSARGLVARARGLRRVAGIAGAGVGAVAMIGFALSQSGLFDRGGADPVVVPPVTTASASAPAADRSTTDQSDADPVRLDPATITPSASSALEPVDGIRYGPETVLDGDPSTAWNDGVSGALGVGEQLTFRFDAPFELTSLEIVNGYDKIDEDSGEDRWEQNGRVDQLGIVTDIGEATSGLDDTREPQDVTVPTGVTCSVELTVESVHDGEDYLDVAISEVVFLGRPGAGTCPP